MEYRYHCTIDTLEHLRSNVEQMLPDLMASRSQAGTSPIHSVILKSFSMWDYPEVRYYSQACGVMLQLEAVDDESFRA